MKLILSTYLRILKERDEFDALFPDLLSSMGIVPVSKPQTGTRQFGVDLSAVGPDPDDGGIEKLFLFVLKQGDIGRNEWDSGPQSVRQSLNEVRDVYLRSHVAPAHQKLRKKVILSTTGDLKEVVAANWSGYTTENAALTDFDFWGADKVALLVERYMLDEHLFKYEDRIDLRRALALAGENDYSLRDFHRLLKRQLGLTASGECSQQAIKLQELVKALSRVNLATRLVANWSIKDGNAKQALLVAERAVLWSWHRLQFAPASEQQQLYPAFDALWQSYSHISMVYFEKLKAHCYVRDGLSGYTGESSLFSLIVFEQIGILASIGLAQVYHVTPDEAEYASAVDNAADIADALSNLITNNPVSGSPCLDENTIDITLGLILLTLMGKHDDAAVWLEELVRRSDYTFKIGRHFPVGTDSIDDLIALECSELDHDERKKFTNTSWLLPTFAGWSVIFQREAIYAALVKSQQEDGYPDICRQLWHPVEDLFTRLYFRAAHRESGETEAPMNFPEDMEEHRQHLLNLLDSARHNILDISPAYQAGNIALDLIACRHFRTPIAPYFWYQFERVPKELPKSPT